MDVLLSIQHPAHVHFFRHAIDELRVRGHDAHVFVRDKSIIRELLDTYGIEYTVLVDESGSVSSLPVTQLSYEWRLLRAARRIGPDVVAGVGGVSACHVATLVGARGIAFTDTEHATLSNRLAFPFADEICTPECYREAIGPKQYRYPGQHELAYLHPDRFTPDPSVLDEVGVDEDDTVVVFRLVDWSASHDVGNGGFGDVRDAVEELEAAGATVLVTSEAPLPERIEDRRATVAPHRMHDLLARADLFVGEGATMAAESAVLGTPALYVNSLETGLTDELDREYGLLYRFHGENRQIGALRKAVSLLKDDDPPDWERRRDRLLEEKCDTTDVIVDRLLASERAVGRTEGIA